MRGWGKKGGRGGKEKKEFREEVINMGCKDCKDAMLSEHEAWELHAGKTSSQLQTCEATTCDLVISPI